MAHVMIAVVAVAIVAIVIVSYFVLAGTFGDKLDANRPSEDTVAFITVDVRIKDFDNQAGTVELKDVDYKVGVEDYTDEGSRFAGLSLAGMW